MDNIPENTEKLVRHSWRWFNEGALFRAKGNNKKTPFTAVISEDELSKVHPDLPFAIRAIIEASNEISEISKYADGYLVQETLNILQHGGVKLYGKDNYMRTYTRIYSITCAEKGNRVTIHGMQVAIKEDMVQGRNIRYVYMADEYTSFVEKNYLDTYFPGWEDRFKIVDSLGIDTREALLDIFLNTNLSPTTPDIQNITFE